MTELTDNDKINTYNKLEKLLKETNAHIVAGDASLYWNDVSQWVVSYRERYQHSNRILYTGDTLFDALTTLRNRA
jgi:hypothetical protein